MNGDRREKGGRKLFCREVNISKDRLAGKEAFNNVYLKIFFYYVWCDGVRCLVPYEVNEWPWEQ